ncbi:MAG: deoxyguanosinetriphosphate triphosphohydrolase [Alphaproteobacteria bacterium]|jgi:dGTPase
MSVAPYASNPAHSRGRLHDEPESLTRTPFQRDRDRIIHSTAFRRLMHKTQVFVYHEGDHYRTRLTHSLEVAQIARSISRVLGLDEDLAEAVALAHDLGHPPFGHAGEHALDQAMADFGGFDHNAQTLRVLTLLEARYNDFDGLNLTWETLEGVVKHNGPIDIASAPPPLVEYVTGHDLELHTHAGLEAQVAAIADDIAYDNHDIDDGLRAGLFTLADLHEAALAGPVFAAAARDDRRGDESRLIHEGVRRMIGVMVGDVIDETRRRLAESNPASADDLRRLGRTMAAFSHAVAEDEAALKAFLHARMYRHPRVIEKRVAAQQIVRELFGYFLDDPSRLPDDWRKQAVASNSVGAARVVADYIAGMTDRFAIDQHKHIFHSELEI